MTQNGRPVPAGHKTRQSPYIYASVQPTIDRINNCPWELRGPYFSILHSKFYSVSKFRIPKYITVAYRTPHPASLLPFPRHCTFLVYFLCMRKGPRTLPLVSHFCIVKLIKFRIHPGVCLSVAVLTKS